MSDTTYPGLPVYCYVLELVTNEVVQVYRGEHAYVEAATNYKLYGQNTVDRLNATINVTKAQEMAMKIGSMFGWDVPAANPANYNEDGTMK